MLGVHEKGELRYAGKVGTGFDTQELFRLQALMKPLARKEATVKAPRSEVRRAHWIEPKLVAEIAYTEMTREGTLRHPRSEEHTAELQSLMRNSYAVFCLQKKTNSKK